MWEVVSHKFPETRGARGELETHYHSSAHQTGPTELHWPKRLICSRCTNLRYMNECVFVPRSVVHQQRKKYTVHLSLKAVGFRKNQ